MELQSGRMGKILDRISTEAATTEKSFADNFIRTRIAKREEDFRKGLMVLCDGDALQYAELLNMSITDYLLKLDNWVTSIEVKNQS